MNKHNQRVTVALIRLAKSLEIQFEELEAKGVTVVALDHAKADVINVALLVNGVEKSDVAAPWLIEPIVSYVENEIKLGECVKTFRNRLNEWRTEWKQGVESEGEVIGDLPD